MRARALSRVEVVGQGREGRYAAVRATDRVGHRHWVDWTGLQVEYTEGSDNTATGMWACGRCRYHGGFILPLRWLALFVGTVAFDAPQLWRWMVCREQKLAT